MSADFVEQLAPGTALYVPRAEYAAAMSLGAVMAEGDSRLFIPSPLPKGVVPAAFERWVTASSKVIWISELLEDVVGGPVDINDVAGIVHGAGSRSDADEENFLQLYVPRFEMDSVRTIPGVSWDRRRRCYVADVTAPLRMIFPYLTPAMKAVWLAERNLDAAMTSLVKAQAMIEDKDVSDQKSPLEAEPGKTHKTI